MYRSLRTLLAGLLILLLILPGCGGGDTTAPPEADNTALSKTGKSTSTPVSDKSPDSSAASGTWDNTPKVLVPAAPGTEVCGSDAIIIDISNTAEGYLMARYTGSSDKVKFFVVTPGDIRYTYDLPVSDSWMALPLTGGNGTYTLDVREHVKDDLYSNLFRQTIQVTLNDEFRPFLYPNQYTWFTGDSLTVKKASELARGAGNALDVVTAVYNYVIGNVTYDTPKAETVQGGYLPDVDETLDTGKGICFDYASLMTAMLRSQGIPTKLEIGYSGETYHAWISTYVKEAGWVDNIIQFDGKNWSLMDPTLAASNKASDVKKYVGDGSHYTVKYSR